MKERGFFRNVWGLITPYWKSEEKLLAWLLTSVIVGLNLGLVYITVLINRWYNSFYNSLQQKNYEEFKSLLLHFLLLAFIYIAGAVYRLYLQQMLDIKWRRWLTHKILHDWLTDNRYYLIGIKGFGSDNPDQRIAEDIKILTGATLSLSLGFISSVTTLISFFLILWNLSGSLDLKQYGIDLVVPGYMVWAAFLYAGFGSVLTHLIGRALIKLQFLQQKFEANFRFALVRLRESAEAVALLKGEEQEERGLQESFKHIWSNWWSIMRYQKRLTWFTAAYSQLATVFPLIVSAPRYFSGAIELGGLMQISSAFGRVQDALSWFIESYRPLTEWKASVDRLIGFKNALVEATNQYSSSNIIRLVGEQPLIEGIALELPSGTKLGQVQDFVVQNGDRIMVKGPSGVGKSTLFRLVSGLWPFGDGKVRLPEQGVLFLPQKPYLPLGTLLEVFVYPGAVDGIKRESVLELMRELELGKFESSLDVSDDWSKRLSLGEQQRIGIIRAILQKPRWIFMDESTASMDNESEAKALKVLAERLPESSWIAISHHEMPEVDFNKTIEVR